MGWFDTITGGHADAVKSFGGAVLTGGMYGSTGTPLDALSIPGLSKGVGGANQTALAQDETAQSDAEAWAIYQRALAEASAAKSIQAPEAVQAGQIAAPAPIMTSKVEAGGLGPFAYQDTSDTQATAVDASPAMVSYQAALAEAADATAAQRKAAVSKVAEVAPATVGAVDTSIAVPTLGPAAQTGGVDVKGVSVDPLANDLRGKLVAAADGIASAPSAAASQFKAAQSQIVADQLAMAGQARGSERAGLRRAAILSAGQQGSTAAVAAAAEAAKEEQAKRAAASSALAGVRSQDVTTATAQAGLDAQRSTLQAQLDAAIAQGNTQAVNAIRTQQAQLEADAAKASLSAALSQQSTQAGLETANLGTRQQTALTNAGAENSAEAAYAAALGQAAREAAAAKTAVSTTNAGAETQAAKDLAAAKNLAGQQFATNATQTELQNAQLRQKQAAENAGRTLTADTTTLQAKLDASKTNAANTLAASSGTAQIGADVAKAQAANELAASGQTAANQLTTTANRFNASNQALTTGINAANTQAKNAQTVVDANKSQSAADTQKQGSIISAAGAMGAAAASDERVKDNIKPVSDAAVLDLAKHVRAVTYEKKPGFRDGADRAGELAQELERSALGRRLVKVRPDGFREVDYPGLAGMMAAAAASTVRKLHGRAAHA